MSRMKLFGTALSESTSRMDFDLALESAENAMNEFAELAKQNEQMVIVNIEDESILEAQEDKALDGIEEGLSVTRVGLNAVNALNDTRLLIAPQIIESTRQDIQLVRQVATTAAAGMGIDPADLLPENMDNTVGQQMSLNMEGFKEKAIAALAAIWRFVQNILDFAIGVFRTNFNLIKIRWARFVRLADSVRKSKKKNAGGELTVKAHWGMLTPEGDYPTSGEQISAMILNFSKTCSVFGATVNADVSLFNMNNDATIDNVVDRHKQLVERMNIIIRSVTQRVGDAIDGSDYVMPSPVGGGRIKVVNGALATREKTGAVLATTQMEWVNAPVKPEGTTVPCLTPEELRHVTTEFMGRWVKYFNPRILVTADQTAKIHSREAEAEAAAYTALLTQTEDDRIIAYITEIAAMRRALVTFRYSAFAQFSRSAADLLDGMYTYVQANYEAQT